MNFTIGGPGRRRETAEGIYNSFIVFFLLVDEYDVAPCSVDIAVSEEQTHELNVMGVAVECGRNGSANVVGALFRQDVCSSAELADTIVNCADMDPPALLAEEDIIFIMETVLFVYGQNLIDEIDSSLSDGLMSENELLCTGNRA